MWCCKKQAKVFILSSACSLIAAASNLQATPHYSLRLESLGQFYRSPDDENLLPFSQYAFLHLSEEKISSDLSVDFRYARSPNGEDDRIDLYQGMIRVAHYAKYAAMEAGRFQLTEGIDYLLVDGVRLHGLAGRYFDWSAFGGWTHSTEIGTGENRGRLVGMRVSLFPERGIRNRINLLIEDYADGAEDQRVGFGIGKDFGEKRQLSLDAGGEHSFVSDRITKLFLIGDVRPTDIINVSLSYFFRNPLLDRNIERDPIFAMFSSSGIHTVRPSIGVIVRKLVRCEPFYEWNTYEATDEDRKITHRGGLLLALLPNPLRISAQGTYSLMRSYGGWSQLVSIVGSRRFNQRLSVRGGGEFAEYEKITNEAAQALRFFAGATFHMNKMFDLSSVFEAISNEDTKRDLRILFMLEMKLGSEV